MSRLEHNRRAWDRLATHRDRFARPATDDDFRDPMKLLDGSGWLGDVRGKRLLALAAGGGRQGPLYAAAGADVTVVDISPAQLELDRLVAHQRKLPLHTVLASMDEMTGIEDRSFDIVVHPVSTCYVDAVAPVFREVARVLRPGGIYLSQHKQPGSLQTSSQPGADGYMIQTEYYTEEPLPPVSGSLHRETGTLEFLHSWEALLGGICRAGFAIEDLAEPKHARADAASGSFAHRSRFVPPYVRIKARRNADPRGAGQQLVIPNR